jgi:hypothetical protein
MLTSRYHAIVIVEEQDGRDTNHLAHCSCGWESLPHPNRMDAVMEICAVLEAELEGAHRKALRATREAARATA